MIPDKYLPVIYRRFPSLERNRMNTLQPSSHAPNALANDPRWQLILRIIESKGFQKSQRMRDFLLYVGERTLSGNAEEVNEQLIGVRVFGRETGYSPAEDNLVRVTARSLRTKIAEYFSTEGAQESLRLEIPKGSYQPEFQAVSAPAEPPRQEPKTSRAPLAAALALSLLAVLVWVVWQNRQRRSGIERSAPNAIFQTFSINSAPVQVVLTDSSLVLLNNLSGRHFTLEEYVNRSFIDSPEMKTWSPREKHLFNMLLSRQITSWADVRLMKRLANMDQGSESRYHPRHARHMQMRDFKQGNFIVMATAPSNPWAELFESSLTFQARTVGTPGEPGFGQAIVNTKPQARELPEYRLGGDSRHGQTSPVRIGVLPALGDGGKVMLIAGITMEGTEAGVEFVCDPARLIELRQHLAVEDLAQLRGWEVLLEAGALQGTARSSKIVATRAHR
jgi:hypothetical protein